MGQGKKWANVDFTLCEAHVCDPEAAICRAAAVCTHRILVQEDPGEVPLLLSNRLCVGCGDCVRACPLHAITITRGL